MPHHARGTFEVKVQPLSAPDMEGVARFSIDKTIHGDLEATTKGEMFTAGDPKAGAAGYVAIETVSGTLAGKSGSFVLQHFATMDCEWPRHDGEDHSRLRHRRTEGHFGHIHHHHCRREAQLRSGVRAAITKPRKQVRGLPPIAASYWYGDTSSFMV